MTAIELASIVNFLLALVAMTSYLRNGLRCKSSWKILKLAFALNLGIAAFLYGLIILGIYYDPLAVHLDTTLLLILFVISGWLGRSKYGNRN